MHSIKARAELSVITDTRSVILRTDADRGRQILIWCGNDYVDRVCDRRWLAEPALENKSHREQHTLYLFASGSVEEKRPPCSGLESFAIE